MKYKGEGPTGVIMRGEVERARRASSVVKSDCRQSAVRKSFGNSKGVRCTCDRSGPSRCCYLSRMSSKGLGGVAFDGPAVPTVRARFRVRHLAGRNSLGHSNASRVNFFAETISHFKVCYMCSLHKNG